VCGGSVECRHELAEDRGQGGEVRPTLFAIFIGTRYEKKIMGKMMGN
jgi:hypothetical protein